MTWSAKREFSLEAENYKRPRSAPSRPVLAPWYQAKSFAITHQDKLTDELFCPGHRGAFEAGLFLPAALL